MKIQFPITQVTALAGDPAYLPCDISTNRNGDSVNLVLWYRDDIDASVYSIDARDRDLEFAERWSDDAVFSNRAYFLPDKKPAELGIDRIRKEEAGIYRCRVDFRIGRTRNSKVNLTVIVPPKRILITDDRGISKEKVVGPYLEGDDLKLHCDVHGVHDEILRSTIVIKNLGRQDVHSELMCNANNNNKSIVLSSTVRIEMTFSPLDVKIIGVNQPLSVGKRYDIVCVTVGSRPPAFVTWWRDNQQLNNSNETNSSDGNVTTSVLSFIPSKSDAGRHLSCRAENPMMDTIPIEDEWILEIQYKPEPRIQLGTSLNRNTIREGTDIYFDCLIHAKPLVYKVEWRHNNRNLHHNVTQGIIVSNQSLVLQSVGRRSAGNYTCVGFNSVGNGQSLPFHLNVMFAPTCIHNQMKIYGVAKQEKVNVSCNVEANPQDVDFRWTFNNSAESIDITGSNIIKLGTSSIFSYTPTTEMDYGTFLCWGTNVIGYQQVPCVYHIIPAGHPDMVYNCSTHNTSTSSFSVKCTEGFNGGLQQSFLLEVKESNSQQLRANLTSDIPQFSVTHLDPGLLYHACIYAFNEKGRSEPMVVQAGTLRLPEKQLTLDTDKSQDQSRHHVKLTPMLSVMIGIVTALVIVAMIVIIVLRIQNGNVVNQGKSHLTEHDNNTKKIPIQRELQFRGSCDFSTDEKHASSEHGKSFEMNGDISEGDDKNPDIIPQQVAYQTEDPMEYMRKRRLQAVSIIDTSPARSLLEQPIMSSNPVIGHGNYIGYCTIRNGMPLRELPAISSCNFKNYQPMLSDQICSSEICTLPRQHWPSPGVPHQSITMTMNSPIIYSGLGVVTRTCPNTTILANDVEAPLRMTHCSCIQAPKGMNTMIPMATGTVIKRESAV
ncbi:hypothetical protein PV327_003923 [Microctonus hyperodae]|uniref:Nephrin/kirre n=1 Tax=Microctonus hyperodae TaxID=165561 RepID=A0AA39G5G7_MICHY|nr:hypothetical protein PV327_003923 [Microctonus hyperodae]